MQLCQQQHFADPTQHQQHDGSSGETTRDRKAAIHLFHQGTEKALRCSTWKEDSDLPDGVMVFVDEIKLKPCMHIKVRPNIHIFRVFI